jgi:hypothetical protein
LHHSQGAVLEHIDRYGQGERIMMPLSDNGLSGDGLLGVTAYAPTQKNRAAPEAPPVGWFDL